jgi:hypothetical protein
MKRLSVMLFAVAALSMLFACGGGGGSDQGNNNASSETQLSGTIATSTAAPGMRASRAPAATPDSVWAVPIAKMQGANIDRVNFILHKTSALDANGNFSFSLAKSISLADIMAQVPNLDAEGFPPDTVFDVDWLLVEMAGSIPLNVIALQGDASFDSMLTMPLSVFTPGSMNLGNVDADTGVAALGVSDIAGDVTLSSSSLQAMARSDKILKSIKDIIRNCDLTTNKCISARQSFVFMGHYSNLTGATYDKAGSYSGYQFYFDLTDYFDSADFDGICPESGPVTVEYQLTPPSAVSVETVTYDASNPFSSGTGTGNLTLITSGTETYTQCFKNTMPLYLRKSNSNSSDWSLQFITGDEASQLTTATPAGDWVLSRKTTTAPVEIGRFEFALANPVDALGNPIVFIPSVRFDTDGAPDPHLTMLHIKWYQWVGSGYVEITDAALLNSLMGGFEISMDDFDGIDSDTSRRSYQENGISFAVSSFDVSNPSDGKGPFLYNSTSTTSYNLTYFGVGYEFGGQSFRFAWRPIN